MHITIYGKTTGDVIIFAISSFAKSSSDTETWLTDINFGK